MNILTNTVISMKTLIIKSLLTSLCQREEIYPSLAKRGKGRFFNNDALLINSLVNIKQMNPFRSAFTHMNYIYLTYDIIYDIH